MDQSIPKKAKLATTQTSASVLRAEENTRRQAVLKENAPKALELATKALRAVQELIEMEKSMSEQVPNTSFIDPMGYSATLADAEYALGVVVHAADQMK